MNDKKLLWLLFKDMTDKDIAKYNKDHKLYGSNKLTRQQINNWSSEHD